MTLSSIKPRLMVLVTWCGLPLALALAQPNAAAQPARPAMTVTLAQAQKVEWPQTVTASGAVVPWHEAVVSARSNGLVAIEVLVDRGSTVKRDQVLVRFDDRSLKVEVAQAEAALEQARSTAEQALRNRDRTLSLRNTGAVTEQEELQAVTNAATTRAQWHQALATLEAAQVRLENAIVRAPDDGTISSRNIGLGQVPGSGMELFRLIRHNRLEWRAEVPAQALIAIHPGQSVQVMLPHGGQAKGRVSVVHPALDSASRLGVVAVDMPPGNSVRAGMFLQGLVRVGQAPAVVVPSRSVVLRDGRAFVFVLSGDRVRRVAVNTGRRENELVEVTSGVQAGDEVVVRGAGFLVDGDLVQVVRGERATEGKKGPAI